MIRDRARADESGVTLVELLVAISITGVVSVGILAGLLTLSTSADRAQKSSDAGSVLYTAADALQTLAYDASCTETYSLTAPTGFPATPPGMRVTSANVTEISTPVRYGRPIARAASQALCWPQISSWSVKAHKSTPFALARAARASGCNVPSDMAE